MGVLRNIGLLATCVDRGRQDDVAPVEKAAVAWADGEITWAGPEAKMPAMEVDEEFDAGGRLVVPGLVDCHTHLAFGGWRADEFEERSKGITYSEIARRGGGILSTVQKTRASSRDQLTDRAREHCREMLGLGVTTIECKSGYGLTTEDELKILDSYRTLSEEVCQRIVPTFLGAHTIPVEYHGKRSEYLDLICGEMIPRVAQDGLAEFCDVFVEETAFTVDEARRVLEEGIRFGLRPKVHADQLSSGGGAELAASVRAVSADHLEQVSADGVRALARAEVVAVSLPIASLYLKAAPVDGRRLIDAGVGVAVATDFNPGSAPSYHLPLAMTLACTMNGLTPAESLVGATRLAAAAIELSDEVGSVKEGLHADLAVVDVDSVNQWLYHFRPNAVVATFCRGRLASGRL